MCCTVVTDGRPLPLDGIGSLSYLPSHPAPLRVGHAEQTPLGLTQAPCLVEPLHHTVRHHVAGSDAAGAQD